MYFTAASEYPIEVRNQPYDGHNRRLALVKGDSSLMGFYLRVNMNAKPDQVDLLARIENANAVTGIVGTVCP